MSEEKRKYCFGCEDTGNCDECIIEEFKERISNLEGFKQEVIKRVSALEKQLPQTFIGFNRKRLDDMEEKLKEVEQQNKIILEDIDKNIFAFKELEQKIDILFKADKGRCQDIAELDNRKQICDHERNELKAVLRDFFTEIDKVRDNNAPFKGMYFKHIIDKLGSEETKGNPYGFGNKKVWEKEPSTQQNIPFEQLIPQTPEFRKAMESIAKEPSEAPIRIEKYEYSGEKLQGKLNFSAEYYGSPDIEIDIDDIRFYFSKENYRKLENYMGKELIAEFISDLKDFWEIVRIFTMSQYDVKTKYNVILEKWEARKNQ